MRIALLMGIRQPWARQVAVRLSELGHKIHVIDFKSSNLKKSYLGSSDRIHSDGISELNNNIAEMHHLDFFSDSDMRYFMCGRQLKKICQKCNADVLLVLYGGGFATTAYSSGFRPYSIYAVGSDVLLVKGIKRLIARRNYSSADLVFVNGSYLTEKARLLAPKALLKSIYMGVNSNRFVLGTPRHESPVKIICTRGFKPIYNNEYLIYALKELSGSDLDFELVFPSSGPTLSDVEQIADRILPDAVRKKIKFLNGVSDSEMLENLMESEIYVSLSRSDGTSISLLEALSCGLFPILSDIPQNREWIDAKIQNGILVPLDEPKVLAEVLKRAVSDSQFRKEARSFNRELILDRGDSQSNMKVLASELESIVERYSKKKTAEC